MQYFTFDGFNRFDTTNTKGLGVVGDRIERFLETSRSHTAPTSKNVKRQAVAMARRLLPPLEPGHLDEGLIATFMIDPEVYGDRHVAHYKRLMAALCSFTGLSAPLSLEAGSTTETKLRTQDVADRLAKLGIALPVYDNHGIRTVSAVVNASLGDGGPQVVDNISFHATQVVPELT